MRLEKNLHPPNAKLRKELLENRCCKKIQIYLKIYNFKSQKRLTDLLNSLCNLSHLTSICAAFLTLFQISEQIWKRCQIAFFLICLMSDQKSLTDFFLWPSFPWVTLNFEDGLLTWSYLLLLSYSLNRRVKNTSEEVEKTSKKLLIFKKFLLPPYRSEPIGSWWSP